MLTPEQVDRIALLARLEITPAERALYARQLSSILDYAKQLAAVDVSGIHPTANVLPIHSVLRDDVVAPSVIDRAGVLMNAPRSNGESFEVPAALSDEG